MTWLDLHFPKITWTNFWRVSDMRQYLRQGIHFSSVQYLSRVWLFATAWTPVHQASPSITNSWSLFKLMSLESVMPSKHLIPLAPSPPAFNLSQHQGLFQWVSTLHQVAKILELWPMLWPKHQRDQEMSQSSPLLADSGVREYRIQDTLQIKLFPSHFWCI